MEDNISLITGAKKEKIPNYDKNNFNSCISNFSRLALGLPPSQVKDTLINLSIKSDIEENFIRPTAWKIFLNVLPSFPEATLKTWIDTVKAQRSAFKKKVKNLKTLKKFAGDPLGNSSAPEWTSIFEESEVKKIITLDVNRTYQDKDLFCSLYIKEILSNILFIWAKEHKSPSYRQGMNEILAVLLYALYPFYKEDPNKKQHSANNDLLYSYLEQPKNYQKELYEFFHDETEMQCDLYYLFTAIMDLGVTKFFEIDDSKKDSVTYLQQRCNEIIDDKLKDYDSRLYNHFKSIELDVSIVLQRYLKCLFNREFHPKDVEVLWDLILADAKKENKTGLIIVDYIAVGMFSFIKNDLLRKDQNECFQRLFKYPPIESPKTLVELCLKVQNDLNEILLRKKVLKMKPQNIQPGVSILEKEKSKSVNNLSSISGYLNSKPPQSNHTVSNNSTSNIKQIEQEEINPNKGNGSNKELVRELHELFMKYRMNMQLSDIGKMDNIFDQLRKNNY